MLAKRTKQKSIKQYRNNERILCLNFHDKFVMIDGATFTSVCYILSLLYSIYKHVCVWRGGTNSPRGDQTPAPHKFEGIMVSLPPYPNPNH